MRHIAIAISLAAFSAAPSAQTLDWGNVLQQGVNEVIRSINTPPKPAPSSPRPIYKPSTSSSSSSSSSSPKASKTRSASEQNVDARIADMLGKPAEFRAFFNKLKKAVAASDKRTLAKMMKYPLNVTSDDMKIFTEKDFTDNYDWIFTPAVIAAVKKQSYADLFVRDQGALVNNVLWFTGVCVDQACKRRVPKVVAVYAPSTDAEAPKQAPPAPNPTVQRRGAQIIVGSSLPTDPVPGDRGSCRNIPIKPAPSLLTITGALAPNATDCYRLTGRKGQTVHIELVSVATGFHIDKLGDNRYDLEFQAQNQPYDIQLDHTFPNSPLDHYELHVSLK